jgi:protein TonB
LAEPPRYERRPEYEPPPRYVAPRPAPAPAAPPQTAYLPVPRRVPAPAAEVSPGYRAALGAWLNSHKRYPETARRRGEQGSTVVRFTVGRSGRVESFAITRSSGYPDLDAAVERMMQGAVLPPFPADMPQPRIEVSVAIRFSLE